MITADPYTKSMVPYSQKRARFSLMCEGIINNLIFDKGYTKRKRVYLFYKSRCKTYTLFLSLFFLLSSFAYCLYNKNSAIADTKVLNIINNFKQYGFNLKFVFSFFWCELCFRLLSFLSGFTVFAFPTVLICSIQAFFTESVIFTATASRLNGFSSVSSFAFVAVFSLQILFDILFFVESSKLYGRFVSTNKIKCSVLGCLFFILYTAFYLLFIFAKVSLVTFGF